MSKADKEKLQQELYSYPIEQVLEQEKILKEVLRMKKIEGDQLDLLSQQAQIRKFQTPTKDIYSVYFPDFKLLGPNLIQLLHQARPHTLNHMFNFGRRAIMADWLIPDHPDVEENKRLIDIHEKYLKDIWTDFVGGDRKAYMRAISIPQETELNQALASAAGRVITPQQLRNQENKLIEKIKSSNFNLLNGVVWHDLGSLTFDDLPSDMRERILESAQQRIREGKIVVDPTKSGEVLYASVGSESDWIVVNKGDGVIEIRVDDHWVKLDVSRQKPPYIELDRYVSPYEERKRIPWVVWSKDKKTGKRDYLNIDLPGILAEGVDARANKRLGIILATSLSEKHRDRLPSFLGLPEAKEKQTMAEPQIPLLVYMYEKMLLEGRFFSAVERSIDGGWRVPEINLNIDDILKGLNTFTKTSPLIPFALFIASFSAVIPATYDDKIVHYNQVQQAINREVGSWVPKEEYEQSFENIKSYFKSQRATISEDDAKRLLYATVRPSLVADVQDRIHDQFGYYNALELPPSRATQNNIIVWGGVISAIMNFFWLCHRAGKK